MHKTYKTKQKSLANKNTIPEMLNRMKTKEQKTEKYTLKSTSGNQIILLEKKSLNQKENKRERRKITRRKQETKQQYDYTYPKLYVNGSNSPIKKKYTNYTN